MVDGATDKSDPPRAFRLLRRACNQGDGFACAELSEALRGSWWLEHRQKQRDYARRALELLRPSCSDGSDGDGDACRVTSRILVRNVIPRDVEAARRFALRAERIYLKGCRQGDVLACYGLEQSQRSGATTGMSGVPASFLATKTADLMRACKSGVADACEYVAQREDDPTEKARLMNRVFQYNAGLCRAGLLQGCKFAVAHGKVSSRPTEEFERRICDLHWRDLYCRGDGAVPTPDEFARLQEQCARGDLRVCRSVAVNETSVQLHKDGTLSAGDFYDQRAGTAKLERLCEWGHIESCERLGRFYEQRRPDAEPQEERARHYYNRAASLLRSQCDAKIPDSCAELASWYQNGSRGLPRDPEAARRLKQRACKLGLPGCSD
ncbi:MAG: SEL1-like repeat protein [Deltaproteobacteria bacterium]|nr:SEL1-like repeat protein [Deltaproteobacteria bacterium]